MKTCAMCHLDLPRSDFTADKRMSTGLKSYCRRCCTIDAVRRYHANPEKARARTRERARRVRTPEQSRARHIWAKYKITMADHDALLALQGGCCAICRADKAGGKGGWHVDHDHATGTVRGLLCASCNVGLGHLREDPAILLAAIAYIQTHSQVRAT